MRVVAEIWAGIDPTRVRAVVRDVELVDVPATGRVRRLADRDVDVVLLRERSGRRNRLQRKHDDEESLRRRVIQARRVGDELRADSRRPVDRRAVAEERVEIHGVVHVGREAGDDVRAVLSGSTDWPEVLKTLITSLTASTT